MFNNRLLGSAVCVAAICLLSSCSDSIIRKKQQAASLPEVPAAKVQELQLHRTLEIPGELRAFQDVAIEAKEQGYISWIGVDRGSQLKRNDKMLTIFCPELDERVKEEEAKYSASISSLRKGEAALDSAKSRLVEARARYDADLLTLQRLQQTAAKMAGSVALNDIDVQTKTVESDKARVESMTSEIKSSAAVVASDKSDVAAALNVVNSVRSLKSYLTVSAPFAGVITERNVHVGSMVGPENNKDAPLVRIQQRNILRLVVAVPGDSVAGLKEGQRVAFSVAAFPGRNFYGTVARPAYALDINTRTMPVELDVVNEDRSLDPGMFATVQWPVSRPNKTLFVPSTAVATDLQGGFVNLIKHGVAQRVAVKKAQSMGNLVEIVGPIKAGDEVALTATDELKSGTHLIARLVKPVDDGNYQ